MRSKARSTLAIVVLTAAVAGAFLVDGGGVDAKAATAGVRIFVRAQLEGAPHTLCVGDTVRLRVDVRKTVAAGSLSSDAAVIGVSVTASTSIGTISPASRVTSMDGSPIGATYFTFKADKAGVAIIRFTSRVNELQFLGLKLFGSDVRTIKTLNIQDCEYKVSVVSLWQVPGAAHINVLATIDFTGLVDQGGGRYTGNAAVQWMVTTSQVGDCNGTLPPESQAQVIGQVLDDDMSLSVTYDTAAVSINIDCNGAGGSLDVSLTPAALDLVSIATKGGTTRRAQILGGPGNDLGDAIITLRPVSE